MKLIILNIKYNVIAYFILNITVREKKKTKERMKNKGNKEFFLKKFIL